MSQIKNNHRDKTYWRSLNEKNNSSEIDSFIVNEFPEGTAEIAETMTRKKFLSLMGASMAMAGLVGCRKPVEKILPYVSAPEEVIPGIPNYYATSVSMGLNSYGIIVESHDSRPTHIEGNESHYSSKGAVNTFVQASILDLYDPDRIKKLDKTSLKETVANINPSDEVGVISNSFNSPTTKSLFTNFNQKYKKVSWAIHELQSSENNISALTELVGKEIIPIYHFDKTDVILSIESDFIGNNLNSLHNQKTFSRSRRVKTKNDKMNRLYCVESTLTSTGMMADHRYKIKPNEIFHFIAELNNALKKNGLSGLKKLNNTKSIFNANYQKFINVLSKDLLSSKGRNLIVLGDEAPKELHSLVFMINQELGNNNKTVTYHTLDDAILPTSSSVEKLIKDINAGLIKHLLILDVDFIQLFSHLLRDDLSKLVDNIVYLTSHDDDTAKEATHSIPKSHYLETWGDTRSIDGTISIVQPLISPLYQTMSINELLSLYLGQDKNDYSILKESVFWGKQTLKVQRKTIHDGFLNNSENSTLFNVPKTSIKSKNIDEINKMLKRKPADSFIARFSISNQIYDGRYINNYWLREVSDPITKISWENVALMSYATAKNNKLKNFDVINISNGSKTIEAPVWVLPGIPDNCVLLEMGFGRQITREVDRTYIDEDVLGFNVLSLKGINSYYTENISISKTNKTHKVACTQDHHGLDLEKLAADAIDDRLPEIIREANIEDYRHNDDFVRDYDRKKHIPDNNEDIPSMYPVHDYSKGPQWGMSIDLNVCSGCNACAIACQSENNIPVVGKDQVMDGREMSWIRMDRYFKGDVDNPEFAVQPVSCLHCENAPCEQVCPVAATTHDEEGLNGMTYNRCIGTRYCANNCPYKVRRFNFYNYTYDTPEVVKMASNPDVTMRFRGVMEKCTFCVQRISQAKITAKNEKRDLIDGDVNVACKSACAMDAVEFGDITDPESRVSKAKSLSHDYSLLKELNTKPRTTYLAKFRNPHPDLVEHVEKKEVINHH